MAVKRYSWKELFKRRSRECLFCGEPDYELLDVHRIVPGELGGKYTEQNSICACSKCHRKTHSGRIVIEGKWFSTSGRYKVFYTEDGVEKVK